jgi:signal peptidase
MFKKPIHSSIGQTDLLRQELSDAQDERQNAGVNTGISKKSGLKRFRDILFILTVLVLIAILLSVLSARVNGKTPEVFGYRLYVVQSSSMSPTLEVGSMFVSKKPGDAENLKQGDIITFESSSGQTITHRIIEVVQTESGVAYRTKGDNPINSPDIDLVTPESVSAVFIIAVPLT